MNYRIITYVIGWVLNLEAICMTLPAVTGLIYGEKTWTSFLITGLISALAGTLLVVRRPEKPHYGICGRCTSLYPDVEKFYPLDRWYGCSGIITFYY